MGRSAGSPLSSLSATPLTPPRQTFADQPRDPECGLVMAEPGAMDIGDAIALGVGAADLWRESHVGAEAIGCRQARALADQHQDHLGAENRADLVAERDARAACDHGTADLDSIEAQSRDEVLDQRDGMGVDRRRRQAVADHDREPARIPAMARQQQMRGRVERPPEIRAPQIVGAVAGPAMDLDRLEAETVQTGNDRGRIEGGMNGVAGTGVVEREAEQRAGGQARAGAAEPDARRGKGPQVGQRAGGWRQRLGRQRLGHRLLGRNRGLAQPDRVVRGVVMPDRGPAART